MSEIAHIIHNIEKNKERERYLGLYASHMMSVANRVSSIRFVMNYDLLYDTFKDADGELPESILEVLTKLNEFIAKPEEEKSSEDIDKIRCKNSALMQDLTYFSDCFVLYEYILNRVEYRFHNAEHLAKSDELFIKKLMNYITSGKDANVIQFNAVSVFEQLPFRMAKGRFLQLVENGMSVYNTSEKSSLADLCYRIRTSALLDAPESRHAAFPVLSEVEKELLTFNEKEVTEGSWERYNGLLDEGFAVLNEWTDFVLLLQEVINDAYVMTLFKKYGVNEVDEQKAKAAVIQAVSAAFAEDTLPDVTEELIDELNVLVGKQEMLLTMYGEGITYLTSLTEGHLEAIETAGLSESYQNLLVSSKLLTNSYFIDLKAEENHELCDEKYVTAQYKVLAEDLLRALEGRTKLYKRAVMSKILALLPFFLTTYQELSDYVTESITGCHDEAEKAGCMEVLDKMMMEQY